MDDFVRRARKGLREKCGPLFDRQKFLFKLDTAGVPGKRTVLSHNPVAWNYDSNWILVVRHSHCTSRPGFTQGFGDFTVAPCLAVWDFQQLTPNGRLKRRSAKIKRHLKL